MDIHSFVAIDCTVINTASMVAIRNWIEFELVGHPRISNNIFSSCPFYTFCKCILCHDVYDVYDVYDVHDCDDCDDCDDCQMIN